MYNLEYRAALSELKVCEGRRLDKVYELEQGLFRFDFGDISAIALVGQYFYATMRPPAAPQAPSAFAMYLRSQIAGLRLLSFTQHRSDRIFVLSFDGGLSLVLEMFSGGNLFLLDSESKILRPYHFKQTEKKKYRVGEKYDFPPSQPFRVPPSSSEWKSLPQESPLSSSLPKLPIGKPYVLEALAISKISPERTPSDLSDQQADLFLRTLSEIIRHPSPVIIFDKQSSLPAELSLVPFSSFPSDKFEVKRFDTFSAAAEEFFTSSALAKKEAKASEEPPALKKLRHRLVEQQAALEKATAELSSLEKKAKYVSENLSLIDGRISEINDGAACASLGKNERLEYKTKKYFLKIVE